MDKPAKKIKFRNYRPHDESLINEKKIESIGAIIDASPEFLIPPLDPIKQEMIQFENTESINIIPKKANWDLKSQSAAKIAKLKRRTQRSIVELLREKMSQEENS